MHPAFRNTPAQFYHCWSRQFSFEIEQRSIYRHDGRRYNRDRDAPAAGDPAADLREPQTCGDYFGNPLRSDLERIVAKPTSFNLSLLRAEPVPGLPLRQVYAFRIDP